MESRKPKDGKIKAKNKKVRHTDGLAENLPAEGALGLVPDTGKDTTAHGGAPLKKQELIAQIVERSNVPRKHAKPVIEAMLAVLGDALSEGRELHLEPMGKVKRKRVKETAKARIVITNIRQIKTAPRDDSSTSASASATPSANVIKVTKEAVADGGEGR